MGENKEFQHIIIFVAKRRSGGPHWFVGELLQFWCSDSIQFLFILLFSSETFSIKLTLININQTIFKHTHLSLQCNKNVSLYSILYLHYENKRSVHQLNVY